MSMLVDGVFAECIPADDRGLLFGETVFETIAFWHQRVPLWALHMNRLAHGARLLGLDPPDPDLLREECRTLLDALSEDSGILRITLTAGSGGQGYWPASSPRPRRIVQRRDWPGRLEQQRSRGLRTMISRHRLGPPGPMSGLKHGNRLLQTLAARECAEAGLDEALLLGPGGEIAEAISSNLILVGEHSLMTPSGPEVAGVGLEWLRGELGTELVDGSISPAELESLREVLVINSVAGVRAVVSIDGTPFERGPVFRRLLSLWQSKLF